MFILFFKVQTDLGKSLENPRLYTIFFPVTLKCTLLGIPGSVGKMN